MVLRVEHVPERRGRKKLRPQNKHSQVNSARGTVLDPANGTYQILCNESTHKVYNTPGWNKACLVLEEKAVDLVLVLY